MPLNQLPELELAYLAGFLDGEGCIMLPIIKFNRVRPSHRLVVVVDNTADHALVRFAIAFGGSVSRIRASRSNQRGHFRWTATDKRAEAVIVALLPYLKIKKDQAEVALEFRKTVKRTGRTPTTDSILATRQDLVSKIHILNARGIGAGLRHAN